MFEEYKKLLSEFIAIPTISSDPHHKADIQKAAEWLEHILKGYGFITEIISGYGNPYVFASYTLDPTLPTALIYGHYDEQPAPTVHERHLEPVGKEDWDTDPFTLVEKDGKLFGRGVMDDKGQFLLHLVTIGNLIKEKKLGYNIKFLFEGEEENGSPFIEQFVKDHKEKLQADFAVISDGEMILGKPTLEISNRGILNFSLTLRTAGNELHSGIYGGAAPNAIHELVKFINNLWDSQNKLTIEGLYNDVDSLDTTTQTPFDFEDYKKNTGAKTILTEDNIDFNTAVGQRPALTVISVEGGFRGEGYKTTIPPVAKAKFNLRLVKSQEPKRVAELIEAYVKKVMPDYVEYQLTFDEFARPSKTDIHNEYVKKAERILEEMMGEKVVRKYVGGTEPVVLYLQEELHLPVLAIPFANEDGHMHGANENFAIPNIEKGLEFSQKFFGPLSY